MPPARSGLPKEANAAIARVIGQPAPVHTEPETRAERIALLVNRIRGEADPEPNVYQQDFHKFLMERVITKDEARGGRVARIPAEYGSYLSEVADALVCCPLLMMEKSRRVLASWTVCAFDIWLAAGGQDERWPELLYATGNRQIVLASRKLEDFQGSQWFLHKRVKFIYEQLIESGIREVWPGFPLAKWTANEAEFSNGSAITAVAQGADQMRGPGATFVHAEEIAFWEQARASVEGALPVLLGGGHFCGITTANANSYASLVVEGNLKNGWRGRQRQVRNREKL